MKSEPKKETLEKHAAEMWLCLEMLEQHLLKMEDRTLARAIAEVLRRVREEQ